MDTDGNGKPDDHEEADDENTDEPEGGDSPAEHEPEPGPDSQVLHNLTVNVPRRGPDVRTK